MLLGNAFAILKAQSDFNPSRRWQDQLTKDENQVKNYAKNHNYQSNP